MNTAALLTREDLIQGLKALEPELRARGVTSLAIFGSRARGDNRPDSDLDLLIDVADKGRFSLIDLARVDNIIGDALGVETYATINHKLDPRFGHEIEPDLIRVFS